MFELIINVLRWLPNKEDAVEFLSLYELNYIPFVESYQSFLITNNGRIFGRQWGMHIHSSIWCWTPGEHWYRDDKLHRLDGPAVINHVNGNRTWFKNGQQHRKGDLPSYETTRGFFEWTKHGKLHRSKNRPAIIRCNGLVEFWVHGICLGGGRTGYKYLDEDLKLFCS